MGFLIAINVSLWGILQEIGNAVVVPWSTSLYQIKNQLY